MNHSGAIATQGIKAFYTLMNTGEMGVRTAIMLVDSTLDT